MTVREAREIARRFDERKKLTDEDVFMFTEAMSFLVNELHDPRDMMHLGGYYYEIKKFDLALKYYEMAATYDYDPAYECLGYIWYYGRTGERDYKKAFEYFSKLMEKGDPVSTYKVADMYKNGYYVEKNQQKYEEIIEKLYLEVKNMDDPFDPIPEVFTRLARIRIDQGKKDEAIDLYSYAKEVLAIRIKYSAFFGNLNIMKWLIDDLYKLVDFDVKNFDFFDMYYLLTSPHKITFMYRGRKQELESVVEDGECHVCFNGKWFRSRDDFYKDACIDDIHLTAIHENLFDFTVE